MRGGARPLGRASPRTAATRRALILVVVLAVAGCAKDITVHVRAGDRPPDPNGTPSVASHALVAAGIAIDRVQIVLRDVRLQANPVADGGPSPGDMAVSPPTLLVDLSGARLAPGAMTEVVPPRTVSWEAFYQAVLELRPVTADDVAADPALSPLQGRTLVFTGRMPGGAPFTFESDVAAVLVRRTVFRAGSNHNNLTLNVAPNRWFEGADGEPLDPRDPGVHPTIEANILESIDAYMDDDLDGSPDPLG